jgi:hypothetical protein
MFHGLRVLDKEMNSVAIELLSTFGSKPVQRLVLVASSRKNPSSYRLRVLSALERIVTIYRLDTSSFLDLNVLLTDRNLAIREAVCRVLSENAGAGRDTRAVSET